MALLPRCLPQEQPRVLLGHGQCPAAPLHSGWEKSLLWAESTDSRHGERQPGGCVRRPSGVPADTVTHPQLVPAPERPWGDRQTTMSPASFAVSVRAQDNL